MVDQDNNVEIHLSLSPEKLIDRQTDDTFCKTIIKLVYEKKLSSSEKYFINDTKL